MDRDVVIVGAGVVGAAIARQLTRYDLDVTLLEAGPDVGAGTSKANTALLHTGFDAKPGTLEARLVARGYELLSEYARGAGIPFELTGALLVAWDERQRAEFAGIVERSRANGYAAIRELDAEELYRRDPDLGPGALGALEVPDEGLICPFTTPLAFATEAVLAGCELRRGAAVTGVERLPGGGFRVDAGGESITARRVVNAAGLRSDEVDRMLGGESFTVRPRRGELIVFDKLARPLVRHIVLAVPTQVSKGVLVAPTVFGNVMVGPTAEEVERKDDTSSTAAGLAYLRAERGGDRGRRASARTLPAALARVPAGAASGDRAGRTRALGREAGAGDAGSLGAASPRLGGRGGSHRRRRHGGTHPLALVCVCRRSGYKAPVEHEERAEELEREAERLEEHSERVGEHIDEAQREWEAREEDPTVPGAQPDPGEDEESLPGVAADEETLSEEGGP